MNNPNTILLVDDDDTIRELLAITFDLEGYSIVEACDGGAARLLLEEREVDIILIDLLMPVMDGRKFLEWLRGEKKSSVPAVVLTSIAALDADIVVLEAGANAVLHKPIKPAEILKTIDQLLSERQANPVE